MPTSKIQQSTHEKSGTRYHLTIPLEVLKMTGWTKGSTILWEREGKAYILREMSKDEN